MPYCCTRRQPSRRLAFPAYRTSPAEGQFANPAAQSWLEQLEGDFSMFEKAKTALYVYLEPELHRQLRIHCAQAGISAAVVVRQLLQDFLDKQPAAEPSGRLPDAVI